MKSILLDEIGPGMVFLFIIVFALLLSLGKALNNWYHEIEKRNRYMEAQIRLLAHTAVAQGVDKEKVHDILIYTKLPAMSFDGIENIEERKEAMNKQYSQSVKP